MSTEVADSKDGIRLPKFGKPKPKRYFNESNEDNKPVKIKLKRRNLQNFKGQVIKVEQDRPRPLKPQSKRKIHRSAVDTPKIYIPNEVLEKYNRGEKASSRGVRTKYFKDKLERKEEKIQYATEQAARTELLLHEEQGFIEADDEERTDQYTQSEIARNVDILSASKHFKLQLEFGPYTMRYTKNGRHLLLGGRRGHVAAFDWVTKKLHCEMNVMEEVADVSWLHVHTMFACAQKDWVYIYDNQGTELHCIKRLYRVNRMEFLPYHFLLATGNRDGYLSWLDVSIGEIVGSYNSKLGDVRIMAQNPGNGTLCIGGGKGVVSMWSPKDRNALARIMCHGTPLSALTVDPKGMHMVTAGLDRTVKVWDVRQLSGPLANYLLKLPANQVEVSQRGVLAFSMGNRLNVYNDLMLGEQAKAPYLRHTSGSFVHGMRFCPYEDVLGVSTANGFESLLVPGSGEPNFDALEDNPFQTNQQRREHEVHALLEKIPPELITLDPSIITKVDVPTLKEKVDAKMQLFHLKPPKIDFTSRRKMKGRGGSANAARNKKIVQELKRKEFITQIREAKKEVLKEHKAGSADFIPLEAESKPSVLDRFKPKKRKA